MDGVRQITKSTPTFAAARTLPKLHLISSHSNKKRDSIPVSKTPPCGGVLLCLQRLFSTETFFACQALEPEPEGGGFISKSAPSFRHFPPPTRLFRERQQFRSFLQKSELTLISFGFKQRFLRKQSLLFPSRKGGKNTKPDGRNNA